MSNEVIELIDLPRNTLNNSAVGAALLCPAKYEFSQIRKFKQRGSSALILGSAFHAGQNFANGVMVGGNDRPTVEAIQGQCREALPLELTKTQERSGLEIEWKKHKDGSVDTMERLIDDVVKMAGTYEAEAGRKLEPVFSERAFTLRFKDVEWVFNGRMDAGTRQGAILDFKTSEVMKPEITPFIDVQLTDYNIAVEFGDDELMALMPVVTELQQHVVIRPSPKYPNGRVQILRAPARTRETMDARLKNIATVVGMIRAGYFPKVENWQVCSWCGFLETCNPAWYEINQELSRLKADAEKAEKATNPKKPKPAAGKSKGGRS